MIVSPSSCQSVVVAVELNVSGLYDVVAAVSSFRKSVLAPLSLMVPLLMVK